MATHLFGKKLKIQPSNASQCTAVVKSIQTRLFSSGLRKGTGGRSSFSGIVATVFGSTGFTGRYIVNRLGRIGSQIVAPTRCDDQYSNHLKVMGDLGQILFPLNFTIRDRELIAKTVKHSNVVINLIGREYETRNFSFEDVNITAAQDIARACHDAGVKRLIHFSALGASKDSPSEFLRSKYAGEQAVKEAFPDATIIRPAAIYGYEDRYFNYYASFTKIPYNRLVPMLGHGLNTYKYPVSVSDVASGVTNIIYDPSTVGTTFEFIGPKKYVLTDLVQYLYQVMYRRLRIVAPPPFLQRLVSRVLEMSPFEPYMTRDMLIQTNMTEVPTGLPGLEDIGVTPTKVEDAAIFILRQYRNHVTYNKSVDDLETETYK